MLLVRLCCGFSIDRRSCRSRALQTGAARGRDRHFQHHFLFLFLPSRTKLISATQRARIRGRTSRLDHLSSLSRATTTISLRSARRPRHIVSTTDTCGPACAMRAREGGARALPVRVDVCWPLQSQRHIAGVHQHNISPLRVSARQTRARAKINQWWLRSAGVVRPHRRGPALAAEHRDGGAKPVSVSGPQGLRFALPLPAAGGGGDDDCAFASE